MRCRGQRGLKRAHPALHRKTGGRRDVCLDRSLCVCGTRRVWWLPAGRRYPSGPLDDTWLNGMFYGAMALLLPAALPTLNILTPYVVGGTRHGDHEQFGHGR